MAVAFDAFTQGPNSSITSTPSTSTWTHTVGSGSSMAVLVALHCADVDVSITSVTYNGTAMTLLGSLNTGSTYATRIYGLLNPPVGASTVSITLSCPSTTTYVQMSSTSYSGVSGGFGTVSTAYKVGSTNGIYLDGGDGVSFVALTGQGSTTYPLGAALKGTWRSENPNGTPRTGIIESTARNGVGWNSYNQASDVFNTVKVQLLDASDPFLGTPQQLTNTVYTQNAKYGSGNVFATYSTMNDGTASGASGATATSTSGDWIKADCGAARKITYIVIGYDYLSNLSGGWGVSYTKDVKVQGSLDNSTWTDITLTPDYTTTGSSNGLVTVPLYVNYRYIRLTKTDYFALTEFQVWAMPTPTSGFFAMF